MAVPRMGLVWFTDVMADGLAGIVRSTFLILSCIGYPKYSSKKSKRTYSDHAKTALLVIMEYLKTSFCEFSRLLPPLSDVMEAASISEVPEESTLRKFRKRQDRKVLDKVLAYQSAMAVGNSDLTTAVDATRFSTFHASRYYAVRLKQFGKETSLIKGYTKVSLAVCVRAKVILAADTANSRTADIKRLEPIVEKLAAAGHPIEYVLADKGYDAEYAHVLISERLGAEAIGCPPEGSVRMPHKGEEQEKNEKGAGGVGVPKGDLQHEGHLGNGQLYSKTCSRGCAGRAQRRHQAFRDDVQVHIA
jgi:hypothetical protein